MESLILSDSERFYIIQGIGVNCRVDGRNKEDFRPVELETNILNHAAGSARVKIGNTNIIACISMEVGSLSFGDPDAGRLLIDVECSSTATLNFSKKAGSAIADKLRSSLTSAFNSSCLPLHLLCIQPGKQCWNLNADLLLIENDGNLLDAASIALIAALRSLRLPSSLARYIVQLDSSDGASCSLNTDALPTFITVHKVGGAYILDAAREEEGCSLSNVSVGVRSDGIITSVIKEGCGSLQVETLLEMIEIGQRLGVEMHAAIRASISKELEIKAFS